MALLILAVEERVAIIPEWLFDAKAGNAFVR